MPRTRFFGYPSEPELLSQTIEAAANIHAASVKPFEVKTWPQVFKFGEFIDTNILGAIDACELAYFDVSFPNFNVFFETGYSIGRGKPTIVLINSALEGAGVYLQEIGLFDALGQGRYSNSAQLVEIIGADEPPRPILPSSYDADFAQPLYVLKPPAMFEGMARAIASLTDTATQFRTFDPTEDARMSLRDAVQQVAVSTGVLCAVISRQIVGAENHNLRAAFLSGLARAMDRELLLLNMSSKPLPLDVRDWSKNGQDLALIPQYVQSFALTSLARLQRKSPQPVPLSTGTIQRINLGNTAAENEFRRLSDYFVETPAYRSAMDGHGRIVIGRKGSGKTAIFMEMGERLSQGRRNLVLTLRPEGYQLRKFKDNILQFLEGGTKEHTVAAFWEYLLLLELCHKCIRDDTMYLGRDPDITRLLPPLRSKYGADEYIVEGDFSERTLRLLDNIEDRYAQLWSDKEKKKEYLSRAELTEIVYDHDINDLRKDVLEYLGSKESVVILIDNLDKGWETHGVSSNDLLMLRTLVEVGRKLERALAPLDVESFCLIFLRNDVYELLLDETPDRGKEGKIAIDWTDRQQLKQLLQRRLSASNVDGAVHWGRIATSHVEGEASFDWAIDRCLMRPRYLIDLINRCLGAAASKNHDLIEEADFLSTYDSYSLDVLVNTNLEIRDVAPSYFDAIFALRGVSRKTSRIDIGLALLNRGFDEKDHYKIIDLLIWYGVLGVVDDVGTTTFIYEVEYNSHVLEQIRTRRNEDDEVFEVNKAFWPALKIKADVASESQMPLI